MCTLASWPSLTFRGSRGGRAPADGPFRWRSEQAVLCSLALGQQRQRLVGDVGLEVRALLMRLEGGLVAEQLVEQELRRIVLGPRDQEQLDAFLALRLGQEAVED